MVRRVASGGMGLLVAAALFGAATMAQAAQARLPRPVPLLLARAGGANIAYVLSRCTTGSCVELARVSGATAAAVTAVTPPIATSQLLDSGYPAVLAFANVSDGVLLVTSRTAAGFDRTTVYSTVDAARSWTSTTFGAGRSVVGFTASPTSYLAATATCTATVGTCAAFELERSAVGHVAFRRVAALRAGENGSVSVASSGARIWLSVQRGSGQGFVYESSDSGGHFEGWAEPALACVTAADIRASSGTVLWATCPTGMLVSYYRSTDAGRTWRALTVPVTSGTGGAMLDPVGGEVAMFAHGAVANVLYRISGSAGLLSRIGVLPFGVTLALSFSNSKDALAIGATAPSYAERLYVTTDGGRTFRVVVV